jgi:hypothetical protein
MKQHLLVITRAAIPTMPHDGSEGLPGDTPSDQADAAPVRLIIVATNLVQQGAAHEGHPAAIRRSRQADGKTARAVRWNGLADRDNISRWGFCRCADTACRAHLCAE